MCREYLQAFLTNKHLQNKINIIQSMHSQNFEKMFYLSKLLFFAQNELKR